MKDIKGMKSPVMPKEHFERSMDQLDVCKEKYASRSTMENPEDLKRSADGLASYAKKHRMKY